MVVCELSELWVARVGDLRSGLWDPDPGVQKAEDRGSGSATLTTRFVSIVGALDLCLFVFMSSHLMHVVQSTGKCFLCEG
jgi:hypothetical protein